MAEPVSTDWVSTRFLHGNEPIIIAMGIARYFQGDIVLPVPESWKGIVTEITDGKGIGRGRIYIDSAAADTASKYGVLWGGDLSYAQWVANNEKNYDAVNRELRQHYRGFTATNLMGETKIFAGSPRLVVNAGDIYDQLGAPIVYAFPHRLSEVLVRNVNYRNAGFVNELKANEHRRRMNFIPKVHTLDHDGSYRPLPNEMFTPHMKEAPIASNIALPDNSIAMVFSGTGRKMDLLKQIATQTKHPVVTGTFARVEGGKYVKVVPPRGEFVHVYAQPQIDAVVAQSGFGTLWSAWNAGKPVIFPVFEEGDDEEFRHNRLTIMKRGLGLEIEKPDQIDWLVERSQLCAPAIKALNAELMNEFGTLDGIGYIARRTGESGLY